MVFQARKVADDPALPHEGAEVTDDLMRTLPTSIFHPKTGVETVCMTRIESSSTSTGRPVRTTSRLFAGPLSYIEAFRMRSRRRPNDTPRAVQHVQRRDPLHEPRVRRGFPHEVAHEHFAASPARTTSGRGSLKRPAFCKLRVPTAGARKRRDLPHDGPQEVPE